MRIAIIGAGHAGQTLGGRWAERGHTVVYGVREPEAPKSKDAATATGHGARVATAREAVADAEVVVLATPWEAVRAARDAVDPPRAAPRDGHRDRVPPAAALGSELAARVGELGSDRLRQPRPELSVEVAEVGERLEPLAAVHAQRFRELRA